MPENFLSRQSSVFQKISSRVAPKTLLFSLWFFKKMLIFFCSVQILTGFLIFPTTVFFWQTIGALPKVFKLLFRPLQKFVMQFEKICKFSFWFLKKSHRGSLPKPCCSHFDFSKKSLCFLISSNLDRLAWWFFLLCFFWQLVGASCKSFKFLFGRFQKFVMQFEKICQFSFSVF